MVVDMGSIALQSRLLSNRAAWPWIRPSSPSILDTGEKSKLSTGGGGAARPQLRPRLQPVKLLERNSPPPTGQVRQDAHEKDQRLWLPSAPSIEKPRAVHSAAALAYMGDAIYELYVRRHFLTPPQTMDKYNSQVMGLVCCEAQHALLQQLLKESFLSEEERDIVRWGKNIMTGHKRARRRAGGLVYSNASSLETLIGYLYLTNGQRLVQVMAQLGFKSDLVTTLDIS